MSTSVAEDLPLLRNVLGQPALCLVTGATGYIGGRLVSELLEHGYRVRILARNSQRLSQHPWINQVEVIEGDANDPKALDIALKNVDVAYYLLHALMAKDNFEQQEHDMAELFAEKARTQKVQRIVYLGGMIAPNQELSPHLAARVETGELLRASGVPTIELRAGVVIGSGSASFEMLRYLTERLPIMTTPRWVNNRIQPIAVRDVLRYLVGSAALPAKISNHFDIGGPDVFTYREMMLKYAEAAGLRKRIIIPVPVLTPKLSSGWVALVTPVPFTLAKRLVESLKNEVVCENDDIRKFIPDPPGGLTPFTRAVKLALTKIKDARVETSWSDASIPGTPSEPLPTDPDWAGGTLYKDVRIVHSPDPIDEVWKRIEAIGGENGYSTATWAWRLRGFADKLVGGVGLRRGRRDPNHLKVGDAVDFWRVEQIIPNKLLRLRAEMKMPGLAWLEFAVEADPETKGTTLTQVALYAPKGLFGHAYWWAVWPMHGVVFPSMAKSHAKK
ncbi:MAG: SDR family oxidoreductase, partial [Micrococcales bacterium]